MVVAVGAMHLVLEVLCLIKVSEGLIKLIHLHRAPTPIPQKPIMLYSQ